jgi:hypothetical protein
MSPAPGRRHCRCCGRTCPNGLRSRQLRIRRTTATFENAFGALTGTYPAGYLDQLDAEDDLR